MSLGLRIKEVRKDHKLTGEKFGAMIGGVHQVTLYKYESDKNTPGANLLRKICSQFGVNGHWLLTGEGEKYIKKDTQQKAKTGSKDTEERLKEIEQRLKDLEDKNE